jgi:hypothetical protein
LLAVIRIAGLISFLLRSCGTVRVSRHRSAQDSCEFDVSATAGVGPKCAFLMLKLDTKSSLFHDGEGSRRSHHPKVVTGVAEMPACVSTAAKSIPHSSVGSALRLNLIYAVLLVPTGWFLFQNGRVLPSDCTPPAEPDCAALGDGAIVVGCLAWCTPLLLLLFLFLLLFWFVCVCLVCSVIDQCVMLCGLNANRHYVVT